MFILRQLKWLILKTIKWWLIVLLEKKEYVLDKIKNGVRFELPKYKSALQYQEKNDVCYVFTNNQGKKLFTALDSKLTQELLKIIS